MYQGKEGGWDMPYPVWFGVIANRMWRKRLNLFLFLCWTYQYPCVDVLQDLKEEPDHTVLQEATAVPHNFHDFYDFSKTWSQIPWLFQAWKKKMKFHDFSRFSMTGYTLYRKTVSVSGKVYMPDRGRMSDKVFESLVMIKCGQK